MRQNPAFSQASKNRTKIDLNLVVRGYYLFVLADDNHRLFVIQFRRFPMVNDFLV
jgi:hypothetical protein